MTTLELLMMSLGSAAGGLDDDLVREDMIALLRRSEGERMAGYLMQLRAQITEVLRSSGRERVNQ